MGGHLSETITKGEETPLGVPPTRGSSQATTAPPAWPLLQVWARYVQYPRHPKHCDQGLRETPECVNPAEYVQYRRIRPSDTGALGAVRPQKGGGQGRVPAVKVPGTNTPMGAPGPPQVRGFPISWGLWGIYRAVSYRWAILGVMGRVVRFPPPVGPGPVSPDHPVCHVPSVGGAVEAFFAGRDLAAATCRTYRQALGPLVETVGADRPVTDLDAGLVAAVFEELWADRAPATWNTRRVAVQAFASWCQARWPLAGDLLADVPPRRRTVDNTRAIPLEDLEDLWRRRTVPLRRRRCGGCCTKPPPARRKCWPWSGGPGPAEAAGPCPFEGWQHRHGGVGGAHRPPLGPLPRRPQRWAAVFDQVADPHRPGPA